VDLYACVRVGPASSFLSSSCFFAFGVECFLDIVKLLFFFWFVFSLQKFLVGFFRACRLILSSFLLLLLALWGFSYPSLLLQSLVGLPIQLPNRSEF
jgi:hypothetical protein